jgi:hypothetical protein
MKISISWDITPCGPLKINHCFGGKYCLVSCLSFFDPEDGGYVFLQNITSFSADYVALYPRRQTPLSWRDSTNAPYKSVTVPEV